MLAFSRMRTRFVMLLPLLWSATASASSISCVVGPVSSLANTACSIGNLLFTFGNAAIQNGDSIAGLSTSNIILTPDAADNGFVLSGAITGANGLGGRDGLDLAVRFSTLDGQPWATGVTTGFTGSSTADSTAFTQFFQFDTIKAGNSADPQPGIGDASTSCGIGSGASGTFTCAQAFSLGPVSATAPNSGLTYGIVDGSGTATISSAEFFVNGTAPADVPEPSSLGLGLVGLLAIQSSLCFKVWNTRRSRRPTRRSWRIGT
jgi:hypothetical protein